MPLTEALRCLSVVVPFFNEERNLHRFKDELVPALDALGVPWQLVLVDDGSRDGSLAVADDLATSCRDAKVLIHEVNQGLGAAVRTGIDAAGGEAVVTLDADLTFEPAAIGALVDRYRRGDVDLVSGSPALAGYDADVPWHRIALSRVANLLYQMALGRRLTAVTPIFRLYRTSLLRTIALTSRGFDINAEILAKMLLQGARVAEVPAALHTRRYGQSKLDNRAEIMNHLRLLARVVRWRLVKAKPHS